MSASRVREAGGSAAQEARRRVRARRVRQVLAVTAAAGGVAAGIPGPALWGVLALAAVVLLWPSRAGRWAAGAAGERATARALDGVEDDGYDVLHDARLRGRSWNLDHVLLGPAGVVIVETKQWRRPVTVRRRWPKVVEERVGWQIDAVATAVRAAGHPGTTVHGFVCVHGAPVHRPWWWPGARQAPIGDAAHLRRWLRRLPTGALPPPELRRRVFEVRR